MNELRFSIEKSVKYSKTTLNSIATVREHPKNDVPEIDAAPDVIGGIINNGQLGWMSNGPHIEIVSIKGGNRVASYTFNNPIFSNTLITCVTEIEIPEFNTCILAIGAQCSPVGGLLIVFAVQGSRVLRCVDVLDRITSCTFIPPKVCRDNVLTLFDGCVAVGTDLGKVIFVDLGLKTCKEILFGKRLLTNSLQIERSHIVLSNMDFEEIRIHHKQAKLEHINFGIQLEVLDDAGPVLSILPLPALSVVAVGHGDGRMILYDLCDLEAFHMAYPPEKESPLIRLTYIEPADDPRACVYIWAFHANLDTAIAVMHSLMFEKKVIVSNECVYKNFQSCSPRLTLPTFKRAVMPVSCQSIAKAIPDEEGAMSLCLLAWTSENGGFACLFDLNQWYKEQMPSVCDWRTSPSYLACLPLSESLLLDVWLNANSVCPFNSIQRPEEHFYPTSLTFDCVTLSSSCATKLHWPGLQNQILDLFSRSGPTAILDPIRWYDEMNQASLQPQFVDIPNDYLNQSLKLKQNVLLSIALEYNCVGLLKECAKAWADGSHMGRQPSEGLSLSSLTDWIWERATIIKNRCNDLCTSLFDHSGCTLDFRSRKELWNCARQLHLLADLLSMILSTCQNFIPAQIIEMLKSQRNSIQMASEYQEVLQWLLNMGLLPEGVWHETSPVNDGNADDLIPYPHRILRNYYMARRRKFCELNRDWITPKTKSCRILFIDMFMEKDCNAPVLRNEWKQGSRAPTSDGLYPPPSLQAMLRTLLVPGVSIEKKYMLFVYLFLDLNMALNDERYTTVVQNLIKFPAVFKLKPALIRTTQAFWHLDHGEFGTAIEELVSPFSRELHISEWQQELLIEALLVQGVQHLALRAFRAPRTPISPILEIRTLLANGLIAEAFQLQRVKGGAELLEEFFKGCYEHNKWSSVLELDLNQTEECCLGAFLKRNNSSLSDNLHFVYLLQRSKYMEALAFIEDLQLHTRNKRRLDFETPHTILDSYKSTMTPSTRHLSDLYYSIKDNVNLLLNKQRIMPVPLSSKLMQKNLGIVGGVYQRTLLSTEQTTNSYWIKQQQRKGCGLSTSDVPFLRNPQYDLTVIQTQNQPKISRPDVYVPSKKRRMDADLDEEESLKDFGAPRKRQRLDSSTLKRKGPPINASLLTSFKDTSHITPIKQSTRIFDDESQLQTTLSDTILKTPIVTSSKQDSFIANQPERVLTPHSILKVKGGTRESSVTSFSQSVSSVSLARRASVEPDERLIRFNLPDAQTLDDVIELSDENIILERDIQSKIIDEQYSEMEKISTSQEEEDKEMEIEKQDENEQDDKVTPEKVSRASIPYSLRESPLQRQITFKDGPKSRKSLRSSSLAPELLTPTEKEPILLQKMISRSESPENISENETMSHFREGPKARRSLRSSSSISAIRQEPPEKISKLDTFGEAQVQKKKKNAEIIEEDNNEMTSVTLRSDRFPLGRRSYRSETPEIEPLPAVSKRQSSKLHLKSSTPNKPKPLSRLVFEINAKKFSGDRPTDPQSLNNAIESGLTPDNSKLTLSSLQPDDSILAIIGKKQRLFPDTDESGDISADSNMDMDISDATDESFKRLFERKRIFVDSTPFTTVEGNWSSLTSPDTDAECTVDENVYQEEIENTENEEMEPDQFVEMQKPEITDIQNQDEILTVEQTIETEDNEKKDSGYGLESELVKPEPSPPIVQPVDHIIELDSDDDDDDVGENVKPILDRSFHSNEEMMVEALEEEGNELENEEDVDNESGSEENSDEGDEEDEEEEEEEEEEVEIEDNENEEEEVEIEENENEDDNDNIVELYEDQIRNYADESSSSVSEKNSEEDSDDDGSTESSDMSSDNNHLITEPDQQENIQIKQISPNDDKLETGVENEIINLSSDSNSNDSVEDDKPIETDARSREYGMSTLQQFEDLSSIMVGQITSETLSDNKQVVEKIQENEGELEANDSLVMDDVDQGSQDGFATLTAQASSVEKCSLTQMSESTGTHVDSLNKGHILSTDASVTGDSTFLTASDADISDALEIETTEILNIAAVNEEVTSSEHITESTDHIIPEEDATVSVKDESRLNTAFAIEKTVASDVDMTKDAEILTMSEKVADKMESENKPDEPVPSTSRNLRNTRSKSREPELYSPNRILRKTRASSVSNFEFQPKVIDSPSIGRRTRASSVPKSASIIQPTEQLLNTPPRRRSRRLSTLDVTAEDPVTPTELTTPRRLVRSKTTPNRDMDTSLDSTISQNTRSKTTASPSNRNFKGSKESLVSRKRTRRGNNDEDDSVSVASSRSAKSVRSTRSTTKNLLAKIASNDDDDDRQSTVSNISNRSLTLRSRNKALAVISEDQPMQSMDDDYSMSRRLTRNQTAVLHKMKETMEKSSKRQHEIAIIEETDELDQSNEQSDTESIRSSRSNASKTKSTRQKSQKTKSIKSDSESIQSTTENVEGNVPLKRRLRKASTSSNN